MLRRSYNFMTTLTGLAVFGLFAERTALAADTVAGMQGKRRVLVISAAGPTDAAFRDQRRMLSAWTGGEDRDVSVVQIAGDSVTGSSDDAAPLRARYQLPADRFSVVLIGKDGHVALQSAKPLSAESLSQTIDGMPLRRAGQR
jgi:Domain of unknown function (DUF4174)